MDGRKLRGKRKNKLKPAKSRMSFQKFMDGINCVLEERKEIEDLLSRVLILDSESVLAEMEIKRRNNVILEERRKMKAAEEENKIKREIEADAGETKSEK
ncbi:MAG: hypothetical protein M1276_08420 [Deltaproteobacteria bacterium]|nr:hypothetical protein [Deltaproteobacteria bacterium]